MENPTFCKYFLLVCALSAAGLILTQAHENTWLAVVAALLCFAWLMLPPDDPDGMEPALG